MRRTVISLLVLVGALASACETTRTPEEVSDAGTETSADAGELPRYSVSGRVTSSGAGLSGVVVLLGGDGQGTATTGTDGRYVFGGLVRGNYTVAPRTYVTTPTSRIANLDGADVAGLDFATVVLPLTPPSASTEDLPPNITSSPSFIRMY